MELFVIKRYCKTETRCTFPIGARQPYKIQYNKKYHVICPEETNILVVVEFNWKRIDRDKELTVIKIITETETHHAFSVFVREPYKIQQNEKHHETRLEMENFLVVVESKSDNY